jgi:membrane associated rhomboid family serine protease
MPRLFIKNRNFNPMSDDQFFRYTPGVLLLPMFAVLLIWIVFMVEVRWQVNLNVYGIYPRTYTGLRGVAFSPFIHSSIEHLYNNTLPLAILLACLVYFYRNITWKILLLGILVSGLITWAIGRPSYHIGASGLIYVLASFIFFKGIRTRHYRLVALSLVVVFIYGGMLWYIFPVLDEISWEGHLGGFVTGLFLAFFVKARVPPSKKYAWEDEEFAEENDPFLKHFDEEGNFIENPDDNKTPGGDQPTVKYHYKTRDEGDG